MQSQHDMWGQRLLYLLNSIIKFAIKKKQVKIRFQFLVAPGVDFFTVDTPARTHTRSASCSDEPHQQ
jgi:hypothetical protein